MTMPETHDTTVAPIATQAEVLKDAVDTANLAAYVDQPDAEVAALREALDLALQRWPEVSTKTEGC